MGGLGSPGVGEDVGGEGSCAGGLKKVDKDVWEVFCFLLIDVFAGFVDGGIMLQVSDD